MKINPLMCKNSYKVLKKKRTNQPITIYSPIDIWNEYFNEYISIKIPMIARIQININKNSPDEVECNEIKVKGVYEPAINIYIAQWSNFWKNIFNLLFLIPWYKLDEEYIRINDKLKIIAEII